MSKIELVEYEPSKKEKWNTFVEKSSNGTIFHNLDFLSYHGNKFRENEHHLMFYHDDSLIAIMPFALFNEKDGPVGLSPYGGSYGGIVHKKHLPFRYANGIVASLIDYLKKEGVQKTFIRPPPHHFYEVYTSYIEYLLGCYGFKIARQDVLSVIDLRRFKSSPFEIYDKRCRTAIRKAEKVVRIEKWSNEVDAFYKILKQTYDRHCKRPTHSLEELRKLKVMFSTSLKIDIAYLNDEPIAGICEFLCNPRVDLHFYNAHRTKFRQYYAISLLIHEEILWAKEKGYCYLDFGTSAEGFKWNDGLFTFKESFGATGYPRNTYCLNLKDK